MFLSKATYNKSKKEKLCIAVSAVKIFIETTAFS